VLLTFQRLDVYQCAIRLTALSAQVDIPRGHGAIADQLRRASLSVPLNIAEGAGRASDADAARHYAIARGSAMECAAIFDAMLEMQIVEQAQHRQAMELIARVVAMLTKMSK